MNTSIVKNNTLLEKILNWDLTKIVNFAIKENPTVDAQTILSSEQEYKHFVYLMLISGKTLPIPTQAIDLIWHSHILYTKDYMDFCNQIAGSYIHHSPEEFTQTNFEKNAHTLSEISSQVFGNIVFDFNKQNHVKNVNFQCMGQKA